MALTDLAAKRAKPKDRDYKLSAGARGKKSLSSLKRQSVRDSPRD